MCVDILALLLRFSTPSVCEFVIPSNYLKKEWRAAKMVVIRSGICRATRRNWKSTKLSIGNEKWSNLDVFDWNIHHYSKPPFFLCLILKISS